MPDLTAEKRAAKDVIYREAEAENATLREALENLVDACEQRRVEDFDPGSRVTVIETRTKDILAFHDALDAARTALSHKDEEKGV